jgi:hypothetical protein
MTARRAAVPARVALLAARPDRHNGRALLMARTLAGAGHAVTLYTETEAAVPDGLPEAVRRARPPCAAWPAGSGTA